MKGTVTLVVVRALDATTRLWGRFAVAAEDAMHRGAEATSARPGAQAFDLLGGGNCDRDDVMRCLGERYV